MGLCWLQKGSTSRYRMTPNPASTRVAIFYCLLTCQIAFPLAFGDVIEAAPGQSIEGQLDLVVSEPPGHYIIITPPFAIPRWQLMPDATNELTAAFNVKANKDGWQVSVRDYNPVTSGHMTEWTWLGYRSLKLENPLRVKAANEVNLPEGGIIQTGSRTTGHGQNINVTFLQEGTFTDEPLPEGRVYRIVVTFTGSYA